MPFPQFKPPEYVHWSLSAVKPNKTVWHQMYRRKKEEKKKNHLQCWPKILYGLCHTKYVLPCSPQSFALQGFGVKSGTILHHMPFQAFNTHLLIHKVYLLQCVPPSPQLHHVKAFPLSKHSRVSPRTGKGLTRALPRSAKWIPCFSRDLRTTTLKAWARPQQPHADLRSLNYPSS